MRKLPTLLTKIRGLTDGLTGAMLGASFYAAWSFAVNYHQGVDFATKVSFTHWLMCTLLTYYGTSVMKFFYHLYKSQIQAVIAFCGGMLVTYGILIPVHTIIGTPNILLTLAAGIIPTLVFCCLYSILLAKTEL